MDAQALAKCCKLPVRTGTVFYPLGPALYFVGKKSEEWADRAVTSGWRALTDVPTSLVIQLRKPPVRPLTNRKLRHPEVAANGPPELGGSCCESGEGVMLAKTGAGLLGGRRNFCGSPRNFRGSRREASGESLD